MGCASPTRHALDAVVSVLAGRINTALVAAIGAAGGRAVGLTGADGGHRPCATRPRRSRRVSGERVDLGLVGSPTDRRTLLHDLLPLGTSRSSPASASTAAGALLNVNADTLAAHLAAVLRASRLIIAGGTPGVLDGGRPHDRAAHASKRSHAMTTSGTAHSGMVAKLAACSRALERRSRRSRDRQRAVASRISTRPTGTRIAATELGELVRRRGHIDCRRSEENR